MFGRNKIRYDELHDAEARLAKVTHNLEQVTGTVQKKVDSLSEVALRLEELREALDRDAINVGRV